MRETLKQAFWRGHKPANWRSDPQYLYSLAIRDSARAQLTALLAAICFGAGLVITLFQGVVHYINQ